MRLIEDGTYIVDVTGADLDQIKRVMLDTGKHCKLMYSDEPERKKGKNISQDGFLCSECKFGDFGGFHEYEPNFCPNCGARMDGDTNG